MPDPTHFITADRASLYRIENGKLHTLRVLIWGDLVTRTDPDPITVGKAKYSRVQARYFAEQADGSVKPIDITDALVRADALGDYADYNVLRVSFVDVQQGDGALIESPAGQKVLIDGGDNQMFARYLASRFPDSSSTSPCEIDCILVTHGDADHFAGLTEIRKSEALEPTGPKAYKRLFLKPHRVYHNGLIKRPSVVPAETQLGATTPGKNNGKPVIVGLEDIITEVDDSEMNLPFRQWKESLTHWQGIHNYQIEQKRLEIGDDIAFSFLIDPLKAKGIDASAHVLGPTMTEAANGSMGLKFLGEPPKGDPTAPNETEDDYPGISVSHTINGHSVILQLRYGAFRFLFAGDLNRDAERQLTALDQSGQIDLESEVLKVPHHGSADFSMDFLNAVHPLVSIVSSGDESARKEFIHPRANLMAALGRASRSRSPLILVTELVAFFEQQMWSVTCEQMVTLLKSGMTSAEMIEIIEGRHSHKGLNRFYGFRRAAYGLVKIRTDGKRLLVVTDSANLEMKEIYAFKADESSVSAVPVIKKD